MYGGHSRTKACVPKRCRNKISRYWAIRLVNIRATVGLETLRQMCRASAACNHDKPDE